MDLHEKTVESSLVYQGKVVQVRRKQVILPDGTESTREVVEHPGAVAVVAVDDRQRICLVEQFRSPLDKVLLEIPAGKLDAGESPQEAALRELAEETGMHAGQMIRLASFFASPGYSNEKIHLFLAVGLEEKEASTDPGEFLRVKKYGLTSILKMIEHGEIEDGKTILGISLLINKDNGLI